jgi:hypothetical protein
MEGQQITNLPYASSSPAEKTIRPYSEKDITIVFETISTGSIPVGDARGARKGAILFGIV